MADLEHITIRKADIVMRRCEACGTTTAHIGKIDGLIGTTCLQCLVDGGNGPASFTDWNRWLDKGKSLLIPRGYKSKP